MEKIYLENVDTPVDFAEVQNAPACFTIGQIDGNPLVLHLDKAAAADESTIGVERVSVPGFVRCGTMHMAVTYHCEYTKYDWDGDAPVVWIEFEE